MRGFCLSSSFPEKGVGWLEIPKPQIQNPYDAILEPVAVSPCTSDVHSARANMAGGNAASNLILGKTGQKRPDIVLGHEAVGRVVEVGALVTDFKVGDVVSVPCVTPNWLTLEVQNGWYQHSGGQAGGRFTSLRDHGVFGEYFRIPFADMNLARIPEGVSLAAGVMATDMITTGFSAVEMAEVAYGDTVVVIGIGPVGLMSVAGAALRGAGRIIAVGGREVTRELGGGVVDPLPDDAPFFVKDYYAYYKTPRGYHPRSLNSNGGWNKIGCMSFLNQPILCYAAEIRSAVLVMHGEKAHSCYFSRDTFQRLKGENKELLILPGAVHTDLYDRTDIIPFDKLEEFLQTHLK